MTSIQKLEQDVYALYATVNPNREDWVDWLGKNHVPVVAENASRLAKRFGAKEDLARAAAFLHDIADVKMSRSAADHEETSLAMARDLMQEAGFSDDEIKLTVDDAIKYHSCHDGKVPNSIEGKVLAAADALAHLRTDFYVFATWANGRDETLEDAKSFVLKKIDRDLNDKILFPELRAECQGDYDLLKTLFSR